MNRGTLLLRWSIVAAALETVNEPVLPPDPLFPRASELAVPSNFADELTRHGPSPSERLDLAASQRYCAGLSRSHYENFHVVTFLTPRHLRPAFEAIYAYCRWSDDLADETGDADLSRRLLAWWRGELEAAYAGEARHPVMQALRPVIAEYQIPIEPFAALLSAFEQDQDVLEYDTYPQLLDYCTRSANPVGHLVLHLCRSFDEPRAALSDATCTALQLANFWQDVVPDLQTRQRIYLPREDLARFGVAREDLAERRFTPGFRDLLRFEVERARGLFEQGWPLVGMIPRAVAVDIDLFTRGGIAILDAIAARGYDVLSARPSLGKRTKAGLLARALLGQLSPFGVRAPRPSAVEPARAAP